MHIQLRRRQKRIGAVMGVKWVTFRTRVLTFGEIDLSTYAYTPCVRIFIQRLCESIRSAYLYTLFAFVALSPLPFGLVL
jgi:hypothetical protein